MLSDVKLTGATRYFHGYLADETGKIRFVCFNPSKKAKFDEFARTQEAVSFVNALIKRSKFGRGVEVHVSDNSSLAKSPQKINVTTHLDARPDCPKKLHLKDLASQVPGQIIDVHAKVIEATDVNFSAQGVPVLKAGIADDTGAAVIAVWGEELLSLIRTGKSYDFRACVKSIDGSHQLFTPKNVGRIDSATDLHNVVPLPFTLLEKSYTLSNARIIGVANFSSFYICPSCNKGNAALVDHASPFARCSSCGNLSLAADCAKEVSALLTLISGPVKVHLTADSKQMIKICEMPLSSIDDSKLLLAKNFTAKYIKSKKIIDVIRGPEEDIQHRTDQFENPGRNSVLETTEQSSLVAKPKKDNRVDLQRNVTSRNLASEFDAAKESTQENLNENLLLSMLEDSDEEVLPMATSSPFITK